jgi:hypothetical protein
MSGELISVEMSNFYMTSSAIYVTENLEWIRQTGNLKLEVSFSPTVL